MKYGAMFKKQYIKDVLFLLEELCLFMALFLLAFVLRFYTTDFETLSRGLLGAFLFLAAFLLLFFLDKKIPLTEKPSSARYYKFLAILLLALTLYFAIYSYQIIYHYYTIGFFKKSVPLIPLVVASLQLVLILVGLLLVWKKRIWKREGIVVLSLTFLIFLGGNLANLNALSYQEITILVSLDLFQQLFLFFLAAFAFLQWLHIKRAEDWAAE
ncbi:MAG: hypothetical protein LBE32_04250 [Burkholderiales bacterium]|jgi:hypothetical protein|nr:hypothetical protein [Burkholderiales bacterium]